MVVIPRYTDAPPQVLWWEMDELIFFFLFVFLGILTGSMTPYLLGGIASTFVLSKLKGGKSDGVIIHWLWWHGFPGAILTGPPSHIREFTE